MNREKIVEMLQNIADLSRDVVNAANYADNCESINPQTHRNNHLKTAQAETALEEAIQKAANDILCEM